MVRLIEYVRVSDVGGREGESFQSVRQQREANAAIAKLTKGAEIVETVEALNASGGQAWPEPRLADVIERVNAGEADGVVVYALDRFGRSLRALEVIERWADEGKTFLSASDKFDAKTPSGRMALRMMMVVARFYWETTRDRFALSRRNAIERGAQIGRVPLGLRRNSAGVLEADPDTVEIAREAFALAAADGLKAAASYLERTVPGRRWTLDDVRKLLANRTYLGEVHHGRFVNPHAHESIVSTETWLAAQHEPGARRANSKYPLSGTATCGECGEPMTGQLQAFRDRPQTYRRYRCSNRGCCRVSISADALEDCVRETIRGALAEHVFEVSAPAVGLGGAERALETVESDLARWQNDDRARDALGDARWYAGLEDRVARADLARSAYQELASASALREAVPAAGELDDPDQFARALRAMVDRVTVTRGGGSVEERVTVQWK